MLVLVNFFSLIYSVGDVSEIEKLKAGFYLFFFFFVSGSPGVLAIFFLSPLVSGALMAILFPLVTFCVINSVSEIQSLYSCKLVLTECTQFVLTATGSGPDKSIVAPRGTWQCAGLLRLPIFYVANTLS